MAARAGRGALKRLTIAAAALVAVGLGVLAGRWNPPSPALFAARQRWAADAAQVDASLAALEDRLLSDQARVRLWAELQSRHESVSQVACQNLSEHARAIVAATERVKGEARARKHSLASAGSPRARADEM